MGNPPSGRFHQNNTPRQYSEKIPANLSSRKPIPRKTPPMQANTAIASILKKSDNNINITLILFHYPAIRDGVSCNSRPFPAENGASNIFPSTCITPFSSLDGASNAAMERISGTAFAMA